MNKKQAELQRVAQQLNSEEKYSSFDESVMEAAQRQADAILAQARQQAEETYESLIASRRSDPVAAYRAEAAAKLAREAAAQKQENRKKLLVYRRQLVNALFAEAQEAVEEYVRTPAYLADMAQRMAAYREKAGEHPILYVRRSEQETLGGEAKKVFPGCTVKADATIRLGGFRLETGRVRYDVTLDFAAQAEREAFLSRCGLHVE